MKSSLKEWYRRSMNPGASSLKDKQDWQTFNQTHQEKRERTQINKIRNERRGMTTYTEEIQRIVKFYYEQLHAKKTEQPELNG